MRKILYFTLLIQVLFGQNVPFTIDHPIYYFLERQESQELITGEYWSTRPLTYMQINRMLSELVRQKDKLSKNDLTILRRFQKEFDREFEDEGITFPWSKSTLIGLRHPDDQDTKPFFMTYKQGDAQGWINWSETVRIQHNGQSARGYYTDHLGIFGSNGRIAFTSQFSYHRVTKNDDFEQLPDNYKEGYILVRDNLDWIAWDYPTSSLTYTHPDFTLGIHRQPVYWGYSGANSPILSNNVNPLPHIQWTTEVPHLRYKFLHARLSPNDIPLPDTVNVRRNLTAHRVEFDINANFEFAFNELVIYAHRDFELAYLNPVNFLFPEEHVQGDLDNLLMAFDFKWRLLSGLTTYGTWFLDELDFSNLFSGWWGNKFVFQLGASYYPKANLPSLTLEYTAARPWTYSHLFPVNSFTSAGRNLGLKQGPNSQLISLKSSWQIGPKLFIQSGIDMISQGDDPGADPLNSYLERVLIEGEDVQFMSGAIETSSQSSLAVQYYLSSITQVKLNWMSDGTFELGVKLDW